MDTPPTLPPYTLEDAKKEIDALREKVDKLHKALRRFAGIIKEIEKEEKAPT